MTHNGQPIFVSKQQVSNWAKRVERNDFDITDTKQDFSSNSNNATKFRAEETRQVRTELKKPHMKFEDIVAVNGKQISSSSVRRIAKRKFEDEPPLMVSVPRDVKLETTRPTTTKPGCTKLDTGSARGNSSLMDYGLPTKRI